MNPRVPLADHIAGATLFWDRTGPLLKYGDGVLWIEDLNPEVHLRWTMTRWEIAKMGLRCLLAAIL